MSDEKTTPTPPDENVGKTTKEKGAKAAAKAAAKKQATPKGRPARPVTGGKTLEIRDALTGRTSLISSRAFEAIQKETVNKGGKRIPRYTVVKGKTKSEEVGE